jgi:hypothetical protein
VCEFGKLSGPRAARSSKAELSHFKGAVHELSDTGDRRSRTGPLLATIYSNSFIFPREELGASTATTRYIATQARRGFLRMVTPYPAVTSFSSVLALVVAKRASQI